MSSLTPREQANKIKLFRQHWYSATKDEEKSAEKIYQHLRLNEFNARLQHAALKDAYKISH